MSREIKFRVWIKEDEESKGYMIEHSNPNLNYSETIDTNNENSFLVLMQYTGLKDKNEKEIYEGDVILIEGKNHVIKFEDCYFDAFPQKAYSNTLKRFHDECEIIGNIYEP